jgi:hypothetical protein
MENRRCRTCKHGEVWHADAGCTTMIWTPTLYCPCEQFIPVEHRHQAAAARAEPQGEGDG